MILIKATKKRQALTKALWRLLPILVFIFSFVTFTKSTYAEARPSTITINLSADATVLDLTPDISGRFGKSASTSISVSTDNFTGYTLSIAAADSNGLSDGKGHTIASINAPVTEQDFTNNSAYNNKWGYRPSQYVSTENDAEVVVPNTSFLPAPTTEGTILDITNAANTENNTYQIDLGARLDFDTVSGSYEYGIVIMAVTNDIVYNITYDENTEETVGNMPEENPQVVTIEGTSLISSTTLSDAEPTRTGYVFAGWCDEATTLDAIGNQTCGGTTYAAGGEYGIDQTVDGSNIILYAIWTFDTYTITLNKNGATTAGSATTTATYNQNTLGQITLPEKGYTISGFTASTNNASGATINGGTAPSTITSTYTFNGWYKESAATTLVASSDNTPVLQANVSGFTDTNGKWIATTDKTLYAGWETPAAVNLPTIRKPGYTCGWTETSSGATTIQFGSGASIVPSKNYRLYGVCVAIDYTITLRAGNGIETLALAGWTNTGTATLTKVYHIGDTIDLSSVTPTYKTGYNGAKYAKNDNVGTISGATYTVGAGNGDITINASGLNTPTCTMQGGATKVYGHKTNTLTATSNEEYYDENVNITYSFGYADSATSTLGSFGTAGTANTISIGKSAFYGVRHYGVRVVVTDSNDNTVTNTCTSGTGASTGTTVANRTTMTIVNSRIVFNPNGGTLNGSSALYVHYGGTIAQLYTVRDNNTPTGTLPTVTPPAGHTFSGWYTSGDALVIDENGNLATTAVSGWINGSQKWVKTGASNTSTGASYQLYAHYTANDYNVILDNNGATTPGSLAANVTYGDTTLGTITTPVREYEVKNFSTSGNNASGATVSSTATLNSEYTFNGWHATSGTGALVASNATTPVLQANVSGYTDADGKWIATESKTLYAGWTAGTAAQITLPTITKSGYTCGWTETETGATTIQYNSGASIYPTQTYELYGVCVPINYTITVKAGNGINNLTLAGWTGTGTATLTKTYHIGDTIDLSSFAESYKTGYNGEKYIKNSGAGSLSGTTYTVGAGDANITISASGLNAPVCTMSGGSTKVYNYQATTLTATSNASSYDADSVNITYSFGYATSDTAALGSFGTASASNTTTIAKNAFYYVRYYGVKVVVTDKNDSTITNTCTSGTGTGTGTTVANRTTMALVNARINFNANGGTLNGSSAVYAPYQTANQYTSRNNASTEASIPTVTPPVGYTFIGWYNSSDVKVINADGTIIKSVTSWTDSNGRWVRTGASNSTGTSYTLYAHYSPNTYSIAYNLNGGTSGSSAPTSGTYDAAVEISNPSKTVTVTGDANSSSCTVGSATSKAQTFAGWTSSTIGDNATTSTTETGTYSAWSGTATTNTFFKNLRESDSTTMVATWTPVAFNLPTVTRTGYTCKWYENADGTVPTNGYASGASYTPAATSNANITMYAKATPNPYTITLNGNGATTAGTGSTTATYDSATLSPTITAPVQNRKLTISAASDITVSYASGTNCTSASACSANATLNGYYTATSGGTKVINADGTLVANVSGYTGTNGIWKKASNVTLNAQWTGNAIILPTATKTGYVCNWSDGTNTFNSGSSYTPSANSTTLTASCTIKTNLSLKVTFSTTYVSKIEVKTGSASGTTVGTVTASGSTVDNLTYGTAYYLVPTYTTGSKLSKWAKDSGAAGTLSSTSAANPTYTIGDGTNAVTHTGARKTYTVTLTQCSATTNGSTSATATYYSTALSAITVPQRKYTVSFTNDVSGATASSTSTLTSTYTFGGWVDGSCSGTTLVASNAATPALQKSVSGYTDSSKRWTKDAAATLYAKWTPAAITLPTITKTGHTCVWTNGTNSYNSGASITPSSNLDLAASCTANGYTVTLNKNGATNTPTASTTVTYGATTLGAIATLPTKSNTTNTRTISGFTLGTDASDATVTYPSTGCTSASNCKSTSTTSYTFNGWYKESAATNKIASNAATPALQASTSYTDANKKWTDTSNSVTLYAGWASSSTAYSSVTLPTITKTGYTCNWTDGTNTYTSGASVVPSGNLTLTGTCTIKTDLSLKVTFNTTYVSSIKVCKTSGNCSGTNLVATVTASGTVVPNLTYNTAYYLYPTYTTGSKLSKWAKDSGAVGTLSSTSAANPTYTIGDGTNAVTHTGAYNTYNISYNLNGADTTSNPSTKPTTGTYASAVNISNPTKTVTITGNVGTSGCSNASANYTASAAQTFAGWTSSTISSTATTATSASGTYSAWNGTTATKNQYFKNLRSDNNGTVTMVATWTPAQITLPALSRTGYDCYWNTEPDGTGTDYNPGSGLTPAANSSNSINLYAKAVGKTYTATIYYQSDDTLRGQTISSVTTQCTVSNAAGNCSPTIPTEVTSSVGTYNNSYVGVASAVATMSSSTTITLTGDATYYAVYRSSVTIHKPGTATSTTDVTLYRNQWFTSETAMSTPVLSNSTTGKTNYSYSTGYSDDTGYALYGFAASSNTVTRVATCNAAGTTTCSTIARLALNNIIEAYAIEYRTITATFFYNDNTTTDSCTTANVKTAQASSNRYAYIKATNQSAVSNRGISVPAVVSNSKGTCGQAYKNVGTDPDSMASVTPNTTYGNINYYTRYSAAVSLYYYNTSYTSTTVYRNQRVNGTTTSSMSDAVLATSATGTSNYNTSTGPGSSVWTGYATTSTTTPAYTTVASAATANAVYDKLYTIYTFNVTFAKGTHVSAIGTTSGSCKVNATGASAGTTSCTVATPTITTDAGYTANGWSTTKDDTNAGTAAGSNITLSSNATTYYGNAKAKATTITLNGNNATTNNSQTVTATYDSSTLSPSVATPTQTRHLNIHADSAITVTYGGANCADADHCESNSTFNGYYTTTSSAVKVINDSGALVSGVSGYTDTNGKWAKEDTALTLYAQWTPTQITLPGLSRTGYSCKWYTNEAHTQPSGGMAPGSAYAPAATSNNQTDLYAYCTGNTYTATIYYQESDVAGTTSIKSTTAQCTVSNAAGNCSPTIPTAVTGSVGTFNNSYVGVAPAANTMTSSTSITLTGNATFYAVYRSAVTVYKPSSTTAATSTTLYRNQYFTSASAMSTTVLATTTTGTSNYTYATSYTDSGYNLSGFNDTVNVSTVKNTCGANGSTACNSVANLAASTITTAYAIEYLNITATFYYNDNTVTSSCTTANVKNTSAIASRLLHIVTTTTAAEVNQNISVPTVVKNSKGTCGGAYYNVGTSTGNMTSVTPNTDKGNTDYYTRYRTNVTLYYYKTAYTSGTLRRNQRVNGKTASSMSALVLSSSATGTTNYAPTAGPGSSVWAGYATTSTTTPTYTTVASAATANVVYNTLYSIYTFNANFAKGTHVSAIGATSGSCNVNATGASAGTTSCTVATPTITTDAGYTANGWSTTLDDPNAGTAAGSDITISTNDATYYGNAKVNSYAQTTRYRYQNANGTYPSDYTTAETVNVNYGDTYSWSTSSISNFDTTTYQAASVASYTVTGEKTNSVDIPRNIVTCTKRYRLESATGSWGSYTTDGTITVPYGGTCTYTKPVTDYRGSSAGANNSEGTITVANVTANRNIDLSFYRNTFTLTVSKNNTYISSVTGGGTYKWGETVNISATPATGSHFTSWSKTAGTAVTFGNANNASTTVTMGKGNSTVTAAGAYNTYNISYNLNGADTTSNPSTKPTSGTYASAVNISNPTKTTTVHGNENNSGCTVGVDTSNTRTFAGWTSSTLSSTATTATSASGTYSAWNGTTATKNQYFKNLRSDNNGTVTMVANWSGSLSLPTISREGHDCKWYLNDAGTGTAYNSGSSLTPATEPGTTLNVFAKATPLSYTITLTAGPGVSALTAAGWTGTGTATISKSFDYGSTIDLSTITPTFKTGYSGTAYTKTDSATNSSLSGSTYTVGAGAGAVAIKATTLATPTCAISSNASSTARVYNYATTVFTATDNSSSYDSGVNITYSFGYSTSTTGTLGNFVSAGSSKTITMGATGRLPSTASSGDWRGTRYYGVKVVVTDSADSSITANCTSGTGYTNAANTEADRVRMILRNAYINFDANGGSIDKTIVYTYYKSANVYSGNTNSTVTTLPAVTPPTGHVFKGWYTAATGGTKILNADGTLVNQAVSGWVVADGSAYKWGITTTSSSSRKLYAQYTANTYNIAYTKNGGNDPSSMPTSADYETAVNISNPEKTFTVSINANGQNASIKNASNQDVTSASSSQTFAGWTSTTIGLNAKTGTSSSDVSTAWDGTTTTNQYFKNLNESGTVTMVANWTPVGVVLPNITKTGYTCGYATSATGSIVYNSGSSYGTNATGNSATLFAKCNINSPATPTITGGTTKVFNSSDTTLTCSSSTTYASGTSKYYEFGYAATSTGTVTWLGSPSTTNTYVVKNSGNNQNNYIGSRYYTCRVYASDGSQTSSTATATTKTGMHHVNNRIFFNVAANGGTLSGSANIYTAYQKADVYSGRTTTEPGTIPTATKDTYSFDGWYTAAEGGSKVIAADGTLQPSVSGWTDSSSRWIRNSTADNDTTNVLYAQFDPTTFEEAYAAAGKEKIDVGMGDDTFYSMQDMNPSICSKVTKGEIGWLVDTRMTNAGSIYNVVKAEDGRCWMQENLRLSPAQDTLFEEISALNTNVSASTTINRFNSGGGTTTDKYPITGVANWALKNNSYSQPLYVLGSNYYYNYCAATLGSYCYGDGTSPGSPQGTPTDDICPKGWRLPTGGNSGEVQNLYDIINNHSSFMSRLSITLDGWYNTGGGINEQGTVVYFPSSTTHVWSLTATSFNSNNGAGRMVGMPIRCISKDRYEMQNVTASDLNDLAPNNGDVTTLYDKRDDQEYSVSRLADGNVWMLDNLALDIVGTSLNNLQGNTHSTSTSIERLKNGGGTTSDRYPVSGVSNWTSSYSYSVPQTNTSRKDTVITDSRYVPVNGQGSNKVGVYYNYCAASAGYYCFGSGTNPGTTASGDSTYDICPTGWRLPTENELSTLYSLYDGSFADFGTALSIAGTGWFINGAAASSANAYFWSKTYASNSSMGKLAYYYGDRTVKIDATTHRAYGNSVRCVKQTNTVYMQDVDNATLNSLTPNPGDTAVLYDKRDNTPYAVGKLEDGSFWMLDNLALDLTDSSVQSNLVNNTNATATSIGYLINGGGSANGKWATNGVAKWGSSNSYSSPLVYDGERNTTSTDDSSQLYGWRMGIYYNFCAASAGDYCYESGYNSDPPRDSTHDICPSGWQMPSGSQYSNLIGLYDTNQAFRRALHAPLTGYYRASAITDADSRGLFWSSTVGAVNTIQRLNVFSESTSATVTAGNRNGGYPIRCVKAGDQSVTEFSYTGGVQTYTASKTGTYKLEVWGAQGGTCRYWPDNSNYAEGVGGKGGYSSGTVSLTAGQTIYIAVGGQPGIKNTGGGVTPNTVTAGFNGGGNTTGNGGCGAGGGATHIGTFNSTIAEHGNTTGLYIVAGGGGGGSGDLYWDDTGKRIVKVSNGGVGGGTSGGNSGTSAYGYSNGGTQSEGGLGNYSGRRGSFGQGAGGGSIGGSGGGGLYGGGGGIYYTGGGGGSGYIGGVTNGTTSAGNTSFPDINGGTETGHSGNGYAIITRISN